MRMDNAIRRALYLSLIAWASAAHATPVPVFDARKIIAAADVIALGIIETVQDGGATSSETPNGTLPGRVMFATMRVDQILKGTEPASTARIRFVVPEAANGYGGVAANSYRMVFLSRRAGYYEFVSPYYPSVAAVAGQPVQADNAEDRVFKAVAMVLGAPTAAAQAKREAIHTLRGINSPAAIDGLRASLQDLDSTVRLSATAALLAVNDVTGLPLAEAALLQPGTDQQLVHNLRVSIAEGVRAPVAVPALARLLSAGDNPTRRAVALALAGMQSASVIRPLAAALDDTDFEVRLNAARGLAVISGQRKLTPSWDAFRDDEARFVDPLKAWAATNAGNP